MLLPSSELPLKLEPFPAESGLGYCLRGVSRNGADFHALRRILGVCDSAQFTHAHAPMLSALLGASIEWLRLSLAESSGLARGVRSCYGHTVYAHNHLCVNRPKICAHCIRQTGYCRAIWDFSMSTVCLEHACTLIDHCQKCKQRLRWERPSIEVGHCGHYLLPALPSERIPAELLEWQASLESAFADRRAPPLCMTGDLYSLIHCMSLGGACALASAFGSLERPLSPWHTGQTIKSRTAQEWQRIVLRSIPRMQNCALSQGNGRDISGVIAQPMLMRLLQASANSVDYQIALNLLERIFDIHLDRRLRGLYPHIGQQQLF